MIIRKQYHHIIKVVKVSLSAVLSLAFVGASALSASALSPNGFNEFGYNYNARIFSGKADGVDKNLDGTIYGDPTYANDHLVMKWNKAWDDCNSHGYNDPAYCAGAWDTNEWNGMVSGGSGETEHVKIIWVGAALEASPYWVKGGSPIWGNYETIMDQGMVGGVHNVYTFATPNGLK